MRAARDEIRTRWRILSLATLEGRLGEIVNSTLWKVRYVVVPLPFDPNPSRWPTHPLWEATRACMAEAIEEHAFSPAPRRDNLPTPRAVKRDDLWRQLIGLAATCGALEGLPVDRASDLPGLVAAKIREAERARPGLLEEKMAHGRARNGVFD